MTSSPPSATFVWFERQWRSPIGVSRDAITRLSAAYFHYSRNDLIMPRRHTSCIQCIWEIKKVVGERVSHACNGQGCLDARLCRLWSVQTTQVKFSYVNSVKPLESQRMSFCSEVLQRPKISAPTPSWQPYIGGRMFPTMFKATAIGQQRWRHLAELHSNRVCNTLCRELLNVVVCSSRRKSGKMKGSRVRRAGLGTKLVVVAMVEKAGISDTDLVNNKIQ